MKRNYYIFSSGRLMRKQNTVYFEPGVAAEPEESDEDILEIDDPNAEQPEQDHEPSPLPRRPLPVEDIASIYCFSSLRFNSGFLGFLGQKNITLHLFNYYGYYTGSFYPREPFISGKLLVEQVNAYSDPSRRMDIARRFVSGAAANILKNLRYYNSRERDMTPYIDRITALLASVPATMAVPDLMGIEGNIRSLYYDAWHLIVSESIDFPKRERHPPTNPMNALISFGNALVYTCVLAELYKTQLNPLIGFLHQPGERRFTLSLDIAEIFKPLLADRIIFSLLNKKQIRSSHFTKGLNMCHLSEEGRRLFVREFDEKLRTTIKHRQLKKHVSYRHLIRLECYKLIRHILGEKPYSPFTIWW